MRSKGAFGRIAAVVACALVMAMGNASSPVSALAVINEYATPTASSGSVHITLGPDGNMWFSEYSADKIGKINPANGMITEYAIPTAGARPWGISDGPDGNVWFVENLGHKVGKITPSGVITEYSLGGNPNPSDITTGPDGNLWITSVGGNSIVTMDTSGTILGSYPLGGAGKNPAGITAGPDGNLWFVENLGNAVGKITPSGTITEYPLPNGGSRAWQITVGPDNSLWFTQQDGNRIGKMTTTGVLTEYSLPAGSAPWDITAGPDGNMWITLNGTNKIAMMDMDGTVVESYDIPTPNSIAAGIAKDATNKVWFAQFVGSIGEVANITIPPYDDGDGVAESEEDGAPNNGDGNSDGIPDGRQTNVTSFVNGVTSQYTTVAVGNSCNLSDVQSLVQGSLGADGNYSYPVGLVDFTAHCASTSVKLYFYNPPVGELTLRKYIDSQYGDVAGAVSTRTVIGGLPVLVIEYQLTDGGLLDADHDINGVIVDPVGPALLSASGAADSGDNMLADTGINTSLALTIAGGMLTVGVLLLAGQRLVGRASHYKYL